MHHFGLSERRCILFPRTPEQWIRYTAVAHKVEIELATTGNLQINTKMYQKITQL